MTDQYVLLWSQSQNCFHIEPVSQMYKANARAFVENRQMDYATLWIGRRDQVQELADELRPRLIERDAVIDARRAQEFA